MKTIQFDIKQLKENLRYILEKASKRFWEYGNQSSCPAVKISYNYFSNKKPRKGKILFTLKQIQSVIDFFNSSDVDGLCKQDKELNILVIQFQQAWHQHFIEIMNNYKRDAGYRIKEVGRREKNIKIWEKKKAAKDKAKQEAEYATFKAQQDLIEKDLKKVEKKKNLLKDLNLSSEQKEIFKKLSEIE